MRVDVIGGALPADLRVDLVDPRDSAADANVIAQPMAAAGAAVTQPAILTRAQWGADESLRGDFAGYGETIKAGFVPNLVVVRLSPDGGFTLSSVAPDATHAVIDVLGYDTG